MHWLPLVAMVIASALPFPQSPVSRIAAAATEPGFVERRHDGRLEERPSQQRSRTDYDTDWTLRIDATQRGPEETVASEGSRSGPGGSPDTERQTFLDTNAEDSLAAIPSVRTAVGGPESASEPEAADGGPWLDKNLLEGGEMFLDAHPRVLFSPSSSPPEDPPLLLMLESDLLKEEAEDFDGHVEGHGDRATDRDGWGDDPPPRGALRRDKRSDVDRRRGERSVCDYESTWVTDKLMATDSHGHNVTIVKKIQTQAGQINQYFYETRCRQAQPAGAGSRAAAAGRSPEMGVAGAGCLGVDRKQWVSQCKERQSFVRALTKDANNKIQWRWIRIDSSCVCVLLSRANRAPAREVLTRRGRG